MLNLSNTDQLDSTKLSSIIRLNLRFTTIFSEITLFTMTHTDVMKRICKTNFYLKLTGAGKSAYFALKEKTIF